MYIYGENMTSTLARDNEFQHITQNCKKRILNSDETKDDRFEKKFKYSLNFSYIFFNQQDIELKNDICEIRIEILFISVI